MLFNLMFYEITLDPYISALKYVLCVTLGLYETGLGWSVDFQYFKRINPIQFLVLQAKLTCTVVSLTDPNSALHSATFQRYKVEDWW